MEEIISWRDKKDYLELKKKIRLEVIREIQETLGCKNCKKFKKITEKDLLFREKQR